MAYDPGAIDATLAAAVGDEQALIAELRAVFLESVAREAHALQVAVDEESWRGAALRLKGLAASFGALRLMTLAAEAAASPAGDPALLRRLARIVERL